MRTKKPAPAARENRGRIPSSPIPGTDGVAMIGLQRRIPLVALALVMGCDTVPQAPTVTMLPGVHKSADEFRTDDADCRQYAVDQLGSAVSAPRGLGSGLTSGLSGTAVCPATNRAVGDNRSATAGTAGTLIDGTDSAQSAGSGLQERYNCAYVQCMYARGDRVPLLARERWPAPRSPSPPDPDAYYPRLPR
jgi:hypothetical protein